MAVALTFPGQGSQSVGMGKDLAEQFKEARLVFEEVDDALGQKLSQIIFEGPEDTLRLTANTQPALMAVSMAVIRVMQAQGLDLVEKVNFLAGHSLGEYSALCAAGMFTLADTARLLRIRGNAMQQAVKEGAGAMAAIIGLTEAEVEAICADVLGEGICQIANDNGAGQFVISGVAQAVKSAIALAEKKDAKRAVILPVSAPFHCALMQPAADAMHQALLDVNKNKPVIPVVANVTVEPETDPQRIIELLVHQVTKRVRWRETIQWFGSHDIDGLYEIGAGKVLTGLAKRTNKELNATVVSTREDIENTLKALGV